MYAYVSVKKYDRMYNIWKGQCEGIFHVIL